MKMAHLKSQQLKRGKKISDVAKNVAKWQNFSNFKLFIVI
jgi:hypothetical protein